MVYVVRSKHQVSGVFVRGLLVRPGAPFILIKASENNTALNPQVREFSAYKIYSFFVSDGAYKIY